MNIATGNSTGARHARPGFTLLEVLLALAILTVAFAVLGELARLGMRNARIARDKTQAELLCQSKMAEIAAGVTLPDPVQGVPLESVGDVAGPGWLYSVDIGATEQDGLMAVRVTVAQDLPPEGRPVQFSLVRWMLDASALPSASTTGDQAESTSGTAANSSSASGAAP